MYFPPKGVSDDIVRVIVERTQGVSGAFIKELMRRATQFNLERDGHGVLNLPDVENALDEILVTGGSLNLKLLGGNGHRDDPTHP
jgi:cell division protease FtsH